MKNQRRHELQTNALADRLGGVTLWIEENYKPVLGVVVALAVIVGVYVYLTNSSSAKVQTSWNAYFAAVSEQNPDAMRKVAEDYPSQLAGTWARLWLGDQLLQQGVDQLFQDRAQANDELRKAIAEYEAVLAHRVEPMVAQRANLGLARSYESLDQLDEARKVYRDLVDVNKWPDALFAEQAQARLDDLDRPQTKEFYDWFASQDPKPSIEGSRGEVPLDALKFDSELPDDPVSNDTETPLSGETPVPDAPAGEPTTSETPAADAPASSETPAAEAPATDEPAADDAAAPATEEPAETPPASNP